MLRYFISQFFLQIILIGAIVLFLGIFVYAYSIEGANPPPPDVKTQFQESLGKPQLSKALTGNPAPNAGGVDISVQHMSGPEVAAHLDEIIAEALSFTPSNYQQNVAAMARNFTPGAYETYKASLDKSAFLQILKSRNLRSGAYAEQPPVEVNSATTDTGYKWLFEVPVTVSFLPLQANNYQDGQTTAQNQRFTLRVQFTRVRDAADPNAIRIEIWQMLPPRG